MKILILLLAFAPLLAEATNKNEKHDQPAAQANATAQATAIAAQGQLQGQAQQQQQQQTASGGVIESGAVTINEGSSTNDLTVMGGTTTVQTKQKLQAPMINAPRMNPTGPCMGVRSGGISGPGFGFTGGGSKEDKECTLRETARFFAELGAVGFALQLLCTSEAVEKSGIEGCPTEVVLPPIVPATCDVQDEKLKRCEEVTGK